MNIQTFLHPHNQSIAKNQQLAEQIVSKWTGSELDRYHIRNICSEDFYIDPTTHIIIELLKRGICFSGEDDQARAYVISQIPGFIDKVGSPDYLRNFAVHYFNKSCRNRFKIMEIFEKSMANLEFKNNLDSAVNAFKRAKENKDFKLADVLLRIALLIFDQSQQLKEYSCVHSSQGDSSIEDFSQTILTMQETLGVTGFIPQTSVASLI